MTDQHGGARPGTTTTTAAVGAPSGAPDGLSDDTALWLVRHGETEWSRSGRHTSVTDLPLTEHGAQQAAALAPLFADLAPALVLTSPRQRAVETARLAGLQPDGTDDDLAEWAYGEYEGRTSAEIRDEVPDWTLMTHGAPGGETADQVGARADRVLARVGAALAAGPVVLVGHGHFTRVLGARWIGLPAAGAGRLLLDAAATCLLGAQYGVRVIHRWNHTEP
ncbi:MAG: histidine phosphatase family protein [Jatrophihabitans sp.]|uniref:histidine phosphatase family protein n=1 Tax=Jatrophihabitans sp. TaxID=1932789 RepID=UPI003F7E720D